MSYLVKHSVENADPVGLSSPTGYAAHGVLGSTMPTGGRSLTSRMGEPQYALCHTKGLGRCCDLPATEPSRPRPRKNRPGTILNSLVSVITFLDAIGNGTPCLRTRFRRQAQVRSAWEWTLFPSTRRRLLASVFRAPVIICVVTKVFNFTIKLYRTSRFCQDLSPQKFVDTVGTVVIIWKRQIHGGSVGLNFCRDSVHALSEGGCVGSQSDRRTNLHGGAVTPLLGPQ
jgi:hypothetical protein